MNTLLQKFSDAFIVTRGEARELEYRRTEVTRLEEKLNNRKKRIEDAVEKFFHRYDTLPRRLALHSVNFLMAGGSISANPPRWHQEPYTWVWPQCPKEAARQCREAFQFRSPADCARQLAALARHAAPLDPPHFSMAKIKAALAAAAPKKKKGDWQGAWTDLRTHQPFAEWWADKTPPWEEAAEEFADAALECGTLGSILGDFLPNSLQALKAETLSKDLINYILDHLRAAAPPHP